MEKSKFNNIKFRQILFKINKKVGSIFLGNYKSHFKGRGIEFADVRPYVEGDDTKYIHWNISAKENKLYIKQFEETKEIIIYLMIDISKSMNTLNKFDLAFNISSIIGISALKNSDKIGLILFGDNKIYKIIKAKKGRKHLLSTLYSLYNKDNINLNQVFDFNILKKIIKHSTVLFVISDFIEFDQYNILKYLNIKNQVEIIRIYNPIERGNFTNQIYDFKDQDKKIFLHGKKISNDYKNIVNKYFKEQENIFINNKIKFCDISTNDNVYKKLLNFFHKYSFN